MYMIRICIYRIYFVYCVFMKHVTYNIWSILYNVIYSIYTTILHVNMHVNASSETIFDMYPIQLI